MENLSAPKGFLPTVEAMIGRGELQDAYRLLKNYVSYLRPKPSTVRDVHQFSEGCFWDKEEFLKFVTENRRNVKPLGWVEMPPVKAYYWLAYIACEWNDFNRALQHINEGLAFEYSRPQMICEQAYVLSGLHRFQEAFDSYRKVTSAREWVPDYERARAFRGEGYTLIELNRVDEAERAFKESLRIQPNNETALHELKYISDNRKLLRKYAKKNPLGTDPRAAAARAFAEAERIVNSENDKNLPMPKGREPRVPNADEPLGRALALYEQALRLWRAAGDLAGQAQTMFSMSQLYAGLFDIRKVLEYCHQAQHLWHQADGHEADEAFALHRLGVLASLKIKRNQTELIREAHGYFVDALRLYRKVADVKGQKAVLTALSGFYQKLGEPHKAIGCYEQIRDLEPLPDVAGDEYQVLLSVAKNYERLKEFDFALSYYRQALALALSEGDKRGEAVTLFNIGAVYQVLGNFDEALRHLQNAHSVATANGPDYLVGVSLNALGVIYYLRNEKQKALHCYQQSLEFRRQLKDKRGEAATLINLSRMYLEMQQVEQAHSCLIESMMISRGEKDRAGEAIAIQNMGELCFQGRLLRQARLTLEASLKIQREIADLTGESRTLALLAFTHRELGNLDRALENIESALTIRESFRSKIFNPEWRASVHASNYDLYEFYVDLLVEVGESEDALEAYERGRARSLLDLLAEAGADIRQGTDSALLDDEHKLQQSIVALEQQHIHSPRADQMRLETILTDARAQLELVKAQIRASSPRYAALAVYEPPSLEGIQDLLDTDTLLLEYALGHAHSHLWVISNRSLKYYQLPSREEIEMLADNFYSLLSGQSLRREAREKNRQLTRPTDPPGDLIHKELREATLSLSRVLFEKPAAEIRAAKRLLIVVDGALQCIPFAALTAQLGHRVQASEGIRPLVVDHEIVSLPSASTLTALRSDMRQRQPAPKSVAIFANPVFRPSERVGQRNHATARLLSPPDPLIANPLTRAAADVGVPQRDGWLNPFRELKRKPQLSFH